MNVKIYQIYYLKSQIRKLDNDFTPYNNTRHSDPVWCEYSVFLKSYNEGIHKHNCYTGFLSWRFNEKTRIQGKQFIDFILGNCGYDVYFINPFPEVVALFKNIWVQGEHDHPGLLDFTQKIIKSLNIDFSLEDMISTKENTLLCNYWVGNQKFWDEYMLFTKPVYNYLNNLNPKEEKFIKQIADSGRGLTYIPFIIERLFSTFITIRNDIKYMAYPYSNNYLYIKRNYPEYVINALNSFELLKDNYMTAPGFGNIGAGFYNLLNQYNTQVSRLHKLFTGFGRFK